MNRSFFPNTGTWLKGNIHSHTTQTDGQCPPDQQIRDYCAKGYDFFSITDHNMVVNSRAFAGDTDILLIPGWERDVRHHMKNTKWLVSSPLRRDCSAKMTNSSPAGSGSTMSVRLPTSSW